MRELLARVAAHRRHLPPTTCSPSAPCWLAASRRRSPTTSRSPASTTRTSAQRKRRASRASGRLSSRSAAPRHSSFSRGSKASRPSFQQLLPFELVTRGSTARPAAPRPAPPVNYAAACRPWPGLGSAPQLLRARPDLDDGLTFPTLLVALPFRLGRSSGRRTSTAHRVARAAFRGDAGASGDGHRVLPRRARSLLHHARSDRNRRARFGPLRRLVAHRTHVSDVRRSGERRRRRKPRLPLLHSAGTATRISSRPRRTNARRCWPRSPTDPNYSGFRLRVAQRVLYRVARHVDRRVSGRHDPGVSALEPTRRCQPSLHCRRRAARRRCSRKGYVAGRLRAGLGVSMCTPGAAKGDTPFACSGLSPFAPGCDGVPATGIALPGRRSRTDARASTLQNPNAPDRRLATGSLVGWRRARAGPAYRSTAVARGRARRRALSRCTGGNAANGGDYPRASDPWVTIAPDGTAYQIAHRVQRRPACRRTRRRGPGEPLGRWRPNLGTRVDADPRRQQRRSTTRNRSPPIRPTPGYVVCDLGPA